MYIRFVRGNNCAVRICALLYINAVCGVCGCVFVLLYASVYVVLRACVVIQQVAEVLPDNIDVDSFLSSLHYD